MGQRLEVGGERDVPPLLRYFVARCGRPPHHDEARQFKVLDEVLGSDPGHQLVALMEVLPPVESESVGQGLSDIIGGRWCELGIV